MPPEAANEASQSQDVSLDDLHRAAEEARSLPEGTEDASDSARKEDDYQEDQVVEQPVVKETPEEKKQPSSEKSVEKQPEDNEPPEPKDNRERSQLGRKVAHLEGTLKLYEQQFEHMNQQFQLLTSMLQRPPAGQPTQDELEEALPETPQELNQWFERKLQQREQVRTQEQRALEQSEQTKRQKYELTYLATLEEFGASEDDTALHEEAYKLSTDPGAPFNELHTGDPKKDARINYLAARGHVLHQKFSKAKETTMRKGEEEQTPKNPLKGAPPKAPLGSPSGSSPKPKTQAPVKLDDYAKRAARRLGLTDKDVTEILGAEA